MKNAYANSKEAYAVGKKAQEAYKAGNEAKENVGKAAKDVYKTGVNAKDGQNLMAQGNFDKGPGKMAGARAADAAKARARAAGAKIKEKAKDHMRGSLYNVGVSILKPKELFEGNIKYIEYTRNPGVVGERSNIMRTDAQSLRIFDTHDAISLSFEGSMQSIFYAFDVYSDVMFLYALHTSTDFEAVSSTIKNWANIFFIAAQVISLAAALWMSIVVGFRIIKAPSSCWSMWLYFQLFIAIVVNAPLGQLVQVVSYGTHHFQVKDHYGCVFVAIGTIGSHKAEGDMGLIPQSILLFLEDIPMLVINMIVTGQAGLVSFSQIMALISTTIGVIVKCATIYSYWSSGMTSDAEWKKLKANDPNMTNGNAPRFHDELADEVGDGAAEAGEAHDYPGQPAWQRNGNQNQQQGNSKQNQQQDHPSHGTEQKYYNAEEKVPELAPKIQPPPPESSKDRRAEAQEPKVSPPPPPKSEKPPPPKSEKPPPPKSEKPLVGNGESSTTSSTIDHKGSKEANRNPPRLPASSPPSFSPNQAAAAPASPASAPASPSNADGGTWPARAGSLQQPPQTGASPQQPNQAAASSSSADQAAPKQPPSAPAQVMNVKARVKGRNQGVSDSSSDSDHYSNNRARGRGRGAGVNGGRAGRQGRGSGGKGGGRQGIANVVF